MSICAYVCVCGSRAGCDGLLTKASRKRDGGRYSFVRKGPQPQTAHLHPSPKPLTSRPEGPRAENAAKASARPAPN